MIYENILPGTFLSRPNRFIAHVLIHGQPTVCHVKNTGRCGELLLPGVAVWVQDAGEAARRKTRYDLIAVQKGRRIVNIDSAAPNKLFAEWLPGAEVFAPLDLVRPETSHGDSRFDFYLESGPRRVFAEVKGVTQEFDNLVMFPDAPTLRGVKHLHGLRACVAQGFEAWAVFIIQMERVRYLSPNWDTDPDFVRALTQAAAAGVHLLALDCHVEPDRLWVRGPVEIRL